MGARATKTAQTASNKQILKTSAAKKKLADSILDPSFEHLVTSGTRNDAWRYRGRVSADVAQNFANANMKVFKYAADTGRGLGGVNKIASLTDKGHAEALAEGTKRGTFSRDTNIANLINTGIGTQAQSSRAMTALSQAEFDRAEASARLAATEASNVTGGIAGMVSLGVGKAMQPGNEAIDQHNVDLYASSGGAQKWGSLDNFMKSGTGGIKKPSYWRKLGSAFGAVG
jgi:hypothetical protein